MVKQKQGTLNFESIEQDTSKKDKKTRVALFFGGLLLLIGIIIYVTLSSVSFAADEKIGPTMADGKKQEEKLRKKRLDDEKRLHQMRDKLVENPRAKKDNYAAKVFKDFERIYEENRKKREDELKEGGGIFGKNLEKYGRFDLDKFGKLEKSGQGNVIANNGNPVKIEKKSMLVIADEEKENKWNTTANGKTADNKNRLDKIITSLSRDDIDVGGVFPDAAAIKNAFEPNRPGNEQRRGGLSKREKSSITLSYNNQYPMVTLYEGECLEGAILHEIRSDIQEGPVSVKTSKDYYDESGVYVIIPYGTKILGRTQSINYKGQKRLYIWFERIILPVRKTGERRASIELPSKSIALDSRGINGLVSKVDRHFWLQYGSAILLGVLDGLTGLVQNSVTGGSMSIMIDGTGQNLSRLNNSRLTEYQNIMPTISVKPGTKVKVYITSDINITAYDLKENRPYAKPTKGVKK